MRCSIPLSPMQNPPLPLTFVPQNVQQTHLSKSYPNVLPSCIPLCPAPQGSALSLKDFCPGGSFPPWAAMLVCWGRELSIPSESTMHSAQPKPQHGAGGMDGPGLTCWVLSASSSRSSQVRSLRSICSRFSHADCSWLRACWSFSTFST